MREYATIAKRYAQDVRDGLIPACGYVKQAAERHLRDLSRMGVKKFPYTFDETRVIKVCRFVELMPHTKGKWARRSECIRLEPWQVFILSCVFGWVRKSSGFRRYRIAYIEVPRKNGKSQLSAAIGLYMLTADGDYGAEVYSGATTEKQAWETFRPAHVMASRTESFRTAFGVDIMAKNISVPENGSRFEPIIGKPGDGASPSCAIVDEYHEHQTDDLYDTMLTGMGAREQPLMWVITTAGGDVAGPCYALRSDVVNMLASSVPNEELFGIIYTIDEEDEWTDEASLRKANPNYDVSVSADFLKAQVRGAMASSRKQTVCKTKHLNVWVTARNPWMNMESWNKCADPTLSDKDFEGEPCWMGLDLASKIDITSSIRLYKKMMKEGESLTEHFYLFGRHYVPEAQVENPDRRHYQGWVNDGHLIATEGDVIDYDHIKEDIMEDARRYRIVNLGYDPWGATQLAVGLQQKGIPVVEVMQTVTQLSEPMKWIEALVLAGRLHHDGNPCMNWMVANVTARVDAKDNVFPRKERVDNKIDGLVAALNAMRVAMIEPEKTDSVYKERGIRTV
ncbi:MAG TPA: terminase TerL endonuclease subunit [Rhodothermales bacterium]|nr:terminase TerL endonuclease subunit [Rhodothermales bacterium]